MTLRDGDSPRWLLSAMCLMMIAAPQWLSATSTSSDSFVQDNLVSDIPGLAANTDPNLVNPWGIALSSTSPFWVSDNGTGLATLYNGAGQPQPLVVTIPPPAGGTGPAAPTGQVFNSDTSTFDGAKFIFATEDGTISSWSGGTSATLDVDNSASGAVFKGLALVSNGSSSMLYATDFHNGTVDVFNSSFSPVSVSGGFTDPSLPAGYAPFDIQNIGGKLYVTFALQDADKHDDVPGPGHGFVDVFDTNGVLQERLISMGSLNSPWGLTLAPGSFGPFGSDLLVGNFGDGTINVFDPVTGMFIGTLDDPHGNPIVNLGLWGLTFGNGGNGGNVNTLYFTAGIPGGGQVEDHGLFGSLGPTPEPSTLIVFSTGLVSLLGLGWRRKTAV